LQPWWRDLIEDRSGASGRIGKGEKASEVRLGAVNMMVVVVVPETHRSIVGDVFLRWWREVNVGRLIEREIEKEERSGRRGTSP
jgi:hypothetical protein